MSTITQNPLGCCALSGNAAETPNPLGRLIATLAIAAAVTFSTSLGAMSDTRNAAVPPCCRGPSKEIVANEKRRKKLPGAPQQGVED